MLPDYYIWLKAKKGGQYVQRIIIPRTAYPELAEEIASWLLAKFGPNPEYDSSLQPTIGQFGLPWFRAGALIIDDDGKIILGHEGRVNIDKIEDANFKAWLIETGRCDSEGWADGDGGWNIPAGRLAVGESFEEGVKREVFEECGHTVEVLGIIHVRWGKKYVMPTYLTRDLSGPAQYCTEEILSIRSFSPEGIRALNDAGVLRSPESVMDSLSAYEAYLRGERELNQINSWHDKNAEQ